MKKKLAMFIIPVFLAFHSCLDYSLPSQIELEVEGSIDLPIKISTSSWGSLLTDPLKDAFSGGIPDGIGVEIFNVNYGQDTQAFCVSIPIKISNSLNPNDHMKGITDLTKDTLKIEQSVDAPSFNNLPLDCPIKNDSLPFPVPPGGGTVTYSDGIELSIFPSPKVIPLGSSVSEAFLHTLIKEGDFDIELDLSDGGITLDEDEFTKTYNIVISQAPDGDSPGSSISDPYYGLAYSNSASVLQNLNGQNINKNDIEISGKIILRPKTGSFTVTKKPGGNDDLAGNLNIKMDIKKLSKLDIDWDKMSISDELKDPDPVPLADAAKYLNWIEFDKCEVNEEGEPTKGIGINVSFTKFINGLEMGIECSKLFLFDNAKPIEKSNNVFGNKEALIGDKRLQLDNPADNELKFHITLSPVGGRVLHLDEDMEAGKPLKIEGEAKLFQNWKSAQVNMIEALKYSKDGYNNGIFKGKFPDKEKKEDPIDLSLLDDYIKGFSMLKGNIIAAAYLSGPDKTINKPYLLDGIDPSVLLKAEYTTPALNNPVSLTVLERNPSNRIMLEEKHIDIANDDDYTYEVKNGDKTYRIYKRPNLPPFENDFTDGFLEIINARPENLVFQYDVTLPPTIDILKEYFFDDNNNPLPNDILATIVFLMHLKLTATGENGGQIKYPGMFGDDQKDLLGRESLEEGSMFTSVNVDYLRLAVDFAGTFFTGGNLFIEKDSKKNSYKNNAVYTPVLFPGGIPVDGRSLAINITNEHFDIVRKNFINPDFWLNFEKGGEVTIPKNIGLTSVKIEAKGKSSVKLDF
jgi:hypothetical protein